MTKKIIALVDGSTYSKSVCDHAAWIAGRVDCEVELMHVLGRRDHGTDRADLSGAIALGARSALLDELSDLDAQRSKLVVHRGRAILEDANALLAGAGVAATGHLRHGDLIEAVSDTEARAEMILIGKRGEAADFARGHLGSNLERVMRASKRPLFVVSRAFQPIGRVLVGYDGSASAMRAVEHVAASPLYAGLAVEVVTAGPETEAGRRDLESAAAKLRAAGFDAVARTIPGEPEEALATRVEEAGIDLLVLGASGHSRLRSLFVGSTSLEMMRTCKVPILLVR